MSEQEILDYLLSTGLYEVTDEKRPYNFAFMRIIKMKEFRNKLIQDLYGLNVNADITIEELADDIIEDIQNIVGRDYVKIFGSCPMCMDCPKGCPIDK